MSLSLLAKHEHEKTGCELRAQRVNVNDGQDEDGKMAACSLWLALPREQDAANWLCALGTDVHIKRCYVLVIGYAEVLSTKLFGPRR